MGDLPRKGEDARFEVGDEWLMYIDSGFNEKNLQAGRSYNSGDVR